MDKLEPNGGKKMSEKDKIKADQEKNGKMLREHPINRDKDFDPGVALDVLNKMSIPGSAPRTQLEDDDESGTPHRESSEKL